MATDAAGMAEAFRKQEHWCRTLGSPFSAQLLADAARDIETVGRLDAFLGKWPGDPVADAAVLRVLACWHALALSGRSPELAAHYPDCGGDGNAEGLFVTAMDALTRHADYARDFLGHPPQTNDVGRAGPLMCGLLELAAMWRMPLELFEIGASAGLLQGMDRFRYFFGNQAWGDAASACVIRPKWHGAAPVKTDAPLEIAVRHAVDLKPVDVSTDAAAERLAAYIWADQVARLERTVAAIGLARELGTRVEKASADEWLARILAAEPVSGRGRVLMHSIMWQYMPPDIQARCMDAIFDAGTRARPDAPFAWLYFEPAKMELPPALVLAVWDGAEMNGETRSMCIAHPHGSEMSWDGWDGGKVLASPRIDQA